MKKPTVEERRAEILEVTCQVVIERGFAATRIADVAKKLGVSSSLIHYHFDSKEQLLAEAFAHYARKDVAEMEAEVEAAPNSVGQLDRVVQNYVPEGSNDMEWMLWIDGWG
ncbi:MAG: TetR/AcrR family transcriptional regulator, partial [Ilumatobacteraceae bacterium]